jgi:hypothetical protein
VLFGSDGDSTPKEVRKWCPRRDSNARPPLRSRTHFVRQGDKRLLCILLRQAWPNEFIADGLRKHEPARLVDKSREDAFVAFTFAFLWPIIANLAGEQHV